MLRTRFGAGEENRAKGAKDAKVKGMKDEEIVGVVEGAFVFDKELDDQGADWWSAFSDN